jgi:class 3 adenylate cyclase
LRQEVKELKRANEILLAASSFFAGALSATGRTGIVELPSGTVTFLFTDLEGSTLLWEEHPEAMGDAPARHDAILGNSVAEHHRHVVEMTGDGVDAVCATAHDALDASVAARVELQHEPELAQRDTECRWRHRTPHGSDLVSAVGSLVVEGIGGDELTIRTARLVLRQLERDDAPSAKAVYGDPETMITMPWRLPRTR